MYFYISEFINTIFYLSFYHLAGLKQNNELQTPYTLAIIPDGVGEGVADLGMHRLLIWEE